MKSQLFLFRLVIVATVALKFGGENLTAGEVRTEAVPSPVLGYDWPVQIYLPDGFERNAEKKYPALFLLHGSGGDETDWDRIYPVIDSLIVSKQIPALIAVAPASGTSWWVDGSKRFEAAFIDDLIPYMSYKYHLCEERTAHVIAGFSMGGYGALRYGLAYPRIIGGSILLSPSIYDELPPAGSSARSSGAFGLPFSAARWKVRNFTTIIPDYIRLALPVRFFIGAGDDDWNHAEGIEYNIEQQVVRLYGLLNKKYHNPAELRIVNGGHDWDVWQPLFVEGLLYMVRTLPSFQIVGQK
ncbi:MAG: alpha/beta hydrolase-fold protein [Candidatus Neomarinimicrobiota bacterium]